MHPENVLGPDSCSHKDRTNTRTWPIDVRITTSYELLTSSDSSAHIAYCQLYMSETISVPLMDVFQLCERLAKKIKEK